MSKITFSKMNDGYSPMEVDTYVDMLEVEHIKAVELIASQTAKIAELEDKLSAVTIENGRLKEDSKRFDLEISKAYEERDALKKELEEIPQKTQSAAPIFEDKDSLVEAVLSLARANEKLIGQGNVSKPIYHSKSQVDEIVENVLNETEENGINGPKFSL